MIQSKHVAIVGSGPTRRLYLEIEVSAQIEKVWQAISSVDMLQRWWTDWKEGGLLEPREGGRIIMGEGAWINGHVTIWNPPHILEFTWHDSLPDPSSVTGYHAPTKGRLRIDLVEGKNTRTHMSLIQYLPAQDAAGGAAGWHQFAENLMGYFTDGKIALSEGQFEELKQLYEGSLADE